jgi:hypothetical protein
MPLAPACIVVTGGEVRDHGASSDRDAACSVFHAAIFAAASLRAAMKPIQKAGRGRGERPSSCPGRLEVLAPVVTDGLNEEIQCSGRRAWLPAVQVSTNEMACPNKASVESEELEVVRRRRVWIAWHRPAVTRIAADSSRRSWIKETGPTGSHQVIWRNTLRRRPSDHGERD